MTPNCSVPRAGRRGLVNGVAGRRRAVPAGDVEGGEVGDGDVATTAAVERVGQGHDYRNRAWVTRGDVWIQAPVVGRADPVRYESIVHSLPHLADLLPGADQGAIGRNGRGVWRVAGLARIPLVGGRAAVDDVVAKRAAAAIDRAAVAPVRPDEFQNLGWVGGGGGDLKVAEDADPHAKVR